MKLKKNRHPSTREDGLDVGLAKQAFERIKPTLAEIPADRVEKVRLDLQAVVVVALHVSRIVDRPEVRSRLSELPRTMFQLEDLDRLKELALALWHARAQATDDEARATEAHALAELLEKGRELKAKMIRVLGYAFANDADVVARLDSIRSGIGYKTLASDLTRLANLYLEHQDVLKKDPIGYKSVDVTLAQSYAGQILIQLGERGASDWTELLARLWTRLHEVYENVRHAAVFAFRNDPLGQEFPSLHAATRAKPHAIAVEDDGEDVEEEEDDEDEAARPAEPAPVPAVPVTTAPAGPPPATSPAPSVPAETRDR